MTAANGRMISVDCAAALTDDELIATVQRLLRQERELSACLLVHLGEVDARQLYRQHAYSSMFEYCVQGLHLSEAETYLRIGAARLCRLLDALEQRRHRVDEPLLLASGMAR